MLKTDSLIARYNQRYILALCAIGILVTFGFLLLNQQYNYQKNNAAIINTAGEQRMLSQKISLLANALITEQYQGVSQKALSNRLRNAATKMADNQAYLRGQLSQFYPEKAKQIQTLYYGESELDQRVVTYVATAQKLADGQGLNAPEQRMFFSVFSEQLLQDLDRVVSFFE